MPEAPGKALFPAEAAAHLLGGPPARVDFLGGGRNSRVYGVTDQGGRAFALKVYFRHPADPRDRLGVEWQALRFLWDQGLRAVPRPVGAAPEAGVALYEFIQGAKLQHPAPAHLEACVAFLADLQRLSRLPEAAFLPEASEAHFSLAGVAAHVQARLDRLEAVPGDPPGLGAFLREELLPAWRALLAEARAGCLASGLCWDQALPREGRTLSPSDFGFHNALERQGSLVFLDFEYFGWDDPAKLVADFLLHPGMELSREQRSQFALGMLERLSLPGLRLRTRLAYPLFGIKWIAILLNEFLPADLARRAFAQSAFHTATQAQERQLTKARCKLRQLLDDHDPFPLAPAHA